jgi:hypothetical protein
VTAPGRIALFVACIAAFAAVVACLFLLHRRIVAAAERALARCYDGLGVAPVPRSPRDVRVVFHTYHGSLFEFVQIEHATFLPPDEAREFLRRLNRFNLTWGMLCRGALFVYFLSPLNRFLQLRSIRRQERAALARRDGG